MKAKQIINDIIFITVGTGLYAMALAVFLSPNEISPGGLTGLASALTHITGIPTGFLVLLLNVPLIIWAIKRSGKEFIIKTILTTLLLSIMIDTFEIFMPRYTGDKIISALYGGAVSGVGLALIFLRGSSTGGTDIIAKIVSHTRPHFSMGRVILISDFVVIVTAAAAYRSIDTAMYTFLTIVTMTFVIDYFVYGADSGKLVMIITKNPENMREKILDHVRRGATVIPAQGAYSRNELKVIMCAVRINEVANLNRIVQNTDPKAFMIITNASQIVGMGFTKK